MTILWFGLGLCIVLFLFFCVLSAMEDTIKSTNTQKPPFRNPSPCSNEVKDGVKGSPVNISEPVLSFVETVRKYPERFLTTKGYIRICYHTMEPQYSYRLWDKKTGEWWYTGFSENITFSGTEKQNKLRNKKQSSHSWLTEDEMTYLVKEITSIYEARKDRVEKLKALRKQRRDKQERSRLMKIYAEG